MNGADAPVVSDIVSPLRAAHSSLLGIHDAMAAGDMDALSVQISPTSEKGESHDTISQHRGVKVISLL